MSELCINTATKDRKAMIERLHPLGTVTDRWPDGSFNFKPYDDQCEEEARAECEKLGIECKLL